MKSHNFEIDFDHFQFLIGDRDRGPLVDTSTLWDASQPIGAVRDVSEVIGISTVRHGGKLNVAINVAKSLEVNGDSWVIIGEFEISVPSGKLILWGPESVDLDRLQAIAVSPGRYSAAAYSRGTDDVTDRAYQVAHGRSVQIANRSGLEIQVSRFEKSHHFSLCNTVLG